MQKATNQNIFYAFLSLAAFLLLAASLLLFASCGDANKNNADGSQTTGRDAGAGASDSAPDADGGGGSAEASGGAGQNGGGEPSGGDEPDDVFAPSPEIVYPQEIREQLDKFQEEASKLNLDDIASAAALLRLYRELALDGPVNDALYFAYEENMQLACDSLNSIYEEEPPDEDTVNDALENGFLFIQEDGYAYFLLRPDFLKDTFSDTVSERVRGFLNLNARHYEYRADHDFIEHETLMVTLDQLAEIIVDWENYIRAYPDAVNRSDIEVNLDYYLKIYIGSIQIENSGLYSIAGTDENGETLYKLMDEPRQSYLKFIENYSDSEACPLIAELYQIYKDNNFLYTVQVEDFFRKYGLAYDL